MIQEGILNEVLKGYIKVIGAMTQPKGCNWYTNGKSRFSGERISVLVRDGGF